MKIMVLFLIVCFLVYNFAWRGGEQGKENIENCLSLKSGQSKSEVLNIMGTPSSIHEKELILQYYPTRSYSSCQVVLEFKKENNGIEYLSDKFCDDGVKYVCHS
ncbi:MAG: hypothetical protein MK214_16990 [Thalassotalea sp.]|nr:hypothetical protein [Thalassotalea sp.]